MEVKLKYKDIIILKDIIMKIYSVRNLQVKPHKKTELEP